MTKFIFDHKQGKALSGLQTPSICRLIIYTDGVAIYIIFKIPNQNITGKFSINYNDSAPTYECSLFSFVSCPHTVHIPNT